MGLLDHTLAPYLDVSTLTTTRLLLLLTDWMSWGWRCSCCDRALCCRSAETTWARVIGVHTAVRARVFARSCVSNTHSSLFATAITSLIKRC